VGWGHNDYGQCDAPEPNADFVAIAGFGGRSLGIYDAAGVGVDEPWQPGSEQDLPESPTVRIMNLPNPFNPSTEIRYWLERAEGVTLSVFDLRGGKMRVLVNGGQPAGWNSVRWDGRDVSGRNVPSGAYLARVETDSRIASCRMMLVR
jgi:hypothetical protein